METATTAQLIEHAWRAQPHTYAEIISNLRWKPYPYLTLIGRAIVEAIVDGGGLIVVNLPPRHGKSEFISYYVPMWFLDMWPHKRVILTTHSADFSMLYGRRVRNALLGESDKTITKVAEDSQAANEWYTVDGGGMFSAGVGGAVTGRGGDLIIVDDPVKNWEEAASEVIQQRNIEWFKTTLWTRREPGATVVILMTRWHRKDLAGFVLSDDMEVKPRHLRFPAFAEFTDDMLGRMPGDALCPERYDQQALNEIRAVEGPRHWAGLYQQTPIDDASALLKRHWFQYYTTITNPFRSYITIDLAYSLKKSADYLVIMNTRVDTHSNIYVWEYLRARLPIRDFLNALFLMVERTTALQTVAIEIPAGETEHNSAIIRLIQNEMGSRGVYFNLKPVKALKDKVSRSQGFIHKVSNGKVWFKKGMNELEDELLNFPTGDHDDLIDTLSQLDDVMAPAKKPGERRAAPPSAMSA